MTQCNPPRYLFPKLGRREISASFDGGEITSDAGGLFLRQVADKTGILRSFSGCFVDHRDEDRIDHTVLELVTQRVLGLALGYEDLTDHDELRNDPFFSVLIGKRNLSPAAGKSTLNRLELTEEGASPSDRYRKIEMDMEVVDWFLVDTFLKAHDEPPEEIVLDLDATDDPLYGKQEGRFFHGYYRHYCYLPLYIFSGEHLLLARLRTADRDGADGSVEELDRIVRQIREAWPDTRIVIRGDSGFCRDDLMAFCEERGLGYLFGFARNDRLARMIEERMEEARRIHEETGRPARVFQELVYRTRTSWSATRRVVAKAEYLPGKANPRYVVTNIPVEEMDARTLYEDLYCARGDMENRIKEQQLYLFATRTSAQTMRANQIRLIFSSVAYLLLHALRRLALKGTELARAQCHTIRTKLLKIGAQIRVTVRKIWVSMAGGYPYQRLFAHIYEKLKRLQPRQI
jgi:hypothetical protein